MPQSDAVRLGTVTHLPRAGWATVAGIGDVPVGLGLTATAGQACLVVPTAGAGLVCIPLAAGGTGPGGDYLPLAGGTLTGDLTLDTPGPASQPNTLLRMTKEATQAPNGEVVAQVGWSDVFTDSLDIYSERDLTISAGDASGDGRQVFAIAGAYYLDLVPRWDSGTRALFIRNGFSGPVVLQVEPTRVLSQVPISLPGAPTLPAHAATKAYVDGLMPAPGPRIATGTVNVTLTNAASSNVAITFPAGLFTATPVVQATLQNQPGGSGRLIPRAVSVTTSGCSIFVNTGNDAVATATVSVGWTAIQT